jgi:uncharacterized protein (TIGR04255 family)
MQLPLSLEKSPLYDSVIEIRFETSIPTDAVTGFIYSKVAELFPGGIEPLPVSQLPKPMRDANPELKYQPTHKFTSDTYYLTVGPNVLGFGFTRREDLRYPGWKEFFTFYKKVLRRLGSSISQVDRLGVRYINFFQEDNLLHGLNVELQTGWEGKGMDKEASVTFFIRHEQFKSKITIATRAQINNGSDKKDGQVIDIDTALERVIPMEDLYDRVAAAHDITKEIFYSLLSDSFLKEMGPSTDVYDN